MVRRGSTVRVRQRAFVGRKSPEIGDFCCLRQHHRAPSQYRWDRCRARRASQKGLQIDMLPRTAEHLLGREGLANQVARTRRSEPLEQAQFGPGSQGATDPGFPGDRSWGGSCALRRCLPCQIDQPAETWIASLVVVYVKGPSRISSKSVHRRRSPADDGPPAEPLGERAAHLAYVAATGPQVVREGGRVVCAGRCGQLGAAGGIVSEACLGPLEDREDG
jgi:hypothetical protein